MNARALTYIRGTIIGAIANKSLKLPADSASRCSATTHITADVDAMEQGILLLSTGFVEVFQLCFVLCSLYYFIGYIATLLLIPIACMFSSNKYLSVANFVSRGYDVTQIQ